MSRTVVSDSARLTRSGPIAVSRRSASWLSTRLSAASGSLVKRQMTRCRPGVSWAAESAVRMRNCPRSHRSTRYGPLPTRFAVLVSAAHDSIGTPPHTCFGMIRTW
jgi:hypothetical protein